jgi:two-component system response regulator AtoC
MSKVLVVDDEENIRVMLKALLGKHGYEVLDAENASEALEIIQKDLPDFIVTDVRMPGLSGIEFVKILVERQIPSTTIVMSAYGNVDSAIEAIRAGAYDYIMKPFKADEIILTLKKAQEREELRRENRQLKAQIYNEHAFDGMLSKNKKMQSIFLQIDKVAHYKTTVLLIGESGTGKELVARSLHKRSAVSGGPFVAINCGAIPEHLLESELFGYKKGAFTDATTDKKGLFEAAHKGTLFLDEIGEMPVALQVKLLRVLEEGRIRRIGDTRDIDVDVRIIAATTRDLPKLIEEGKFREELFYRLNVVSITLPALRERAEDIPILIEHFIRRNNSRFELKISGIDPDAMKILTDYQWPGNIREIENAIERACLMAESGIIRKADLPDSIVRNADPLKKSIGSDEISIKKTMQYAEAILIRRALEKTGGNKTQAARLLEISHRALLYKIKQYKIQ